MRWCIRWGFTTNIQDRIVMIILILIGIILPKEGKISSIRTGSTSTLYTEYLTFTFVNICRKKCFYHEWTHEYNLYLADGQPPTESPMIMILLCIILPKHFQEINFQLIQCWLLCQKTLLSTTQGLEEK